jgi:UPF0042 nucleotide-binding protein
MMSEIRFNGPFVITGLSGAGKTVLSRSLEDFGYLCVDNIPLDLVPPLFERPESEINRLVVVLDVRAAGFVEGLPKIVTDLRARHPGLRLVFVESSPETLLRRFSVARRPHPLRHRGLEQAIADEREALTPARSLADLIVDTTHLSPHDLRRQVLSLAGSEDDHLPMMIEVESFSYLQGVPPTASLVFDVRFLPNPYFEPELRSLAGDEAPIAAWLNDFDEVHEALARIVDLVVYLVPRYTQELKSQLSIAVGCTGGRHRSVFVAERIGEAMHEAGYEVAVHHRDKDRWR